MCFSASCYEKIIIEIDNIYVLTQPPRPSAKTMSIPNFGDSIAIEDVDPVLFFVQINELLDAALACSGRMGPAFPAGGPSPAGRASEDSEADFADVETAVDHMYKAWLNVPISVNSCPGGEQALEKMKQLSTKIILKFTARTPKDLQGRYGAVLNKINYLHVLKN